MVFRDGFMDYLRIDLRNSDCRAASADTGCEKALWGLIEGEKYEMEKNHN